MTINETYDAVLEALHKAKNPIAIYLGHKTYSDFALDPRTRGALIYYPTDPTPRFYGVPIYKVSIYEHLFVASPPSPM